MFSTVLIANRGEIACRVIRTARRMGLRTVAVFSEADRAARHVAMADEAVFIGAAPARESYLVADRIIAAAKSAGADAIHPGYGFLSENAGFAEACTMAGLVFVGPPASAIRAMGLKDAAKTLMAKAGVPVVPGYQGDDQSQATLAAAARDIGYPVLIKAVAGGGGKGMRRVEEAESFDAALDSAKREAAAAFGDDRVLIEKYVSRPRHIEIQVFADSHGQAVHLFERDCSLQRRHQKVIEEAPAPGMPEAMRRAMGEAAVTAARAIGYRGAGTVEFIADGSRGLREDGFFFMEMNTRLQVEHPVTEMITGTDLVEWQLRVAAGEPLPLTQDALMIRGHAIEARVYAEDTQRGFLPSTGTLERLRFPREEAHLRIDTGVREGDTVSMHYDPMIAKIIAWDATRTGAARRLRSALMQVEAAGLRTNVSFLSACLGHGGFIAGEIDTGFIARHSDVLIPAATEPQTGTLTLAALFVLLEREAGAQPRSPWDVRDGYRLFGEGRETITFRSETAVHAVAIRYRRAGGYIFRVGDGPEHAVTGDLVDGTVSADIAGMHRSAAIVRSGSRLSVIADGVTTLLDLQDTSGDPAEEGEGAQTLTAPMPGKVTQVFVKPGDAVTRGQALAILEAMKMEHTLVAPGDRVIDRVAFAPGDQVAEGAVVVAFRES